MKFKNYNSWINSFDFPTAISPDAKNNNNEYAMESMKYSDNINKFTNKYGLTQDNVILSLFLFQLVKFSFTKDILIAYNNNAMGYHFNTDLSVIQYLTDFKDEYEKLKDFTDNTIECEILYATQEYKRQDYKFIFSYNNEEIKVEYDTSYYSEELIKSFLISFNVLADKFMNENELLRNISIVEDIDNDEDFKIELENEGLINKIFEDAVINNPDKTILYAGDDELTYSQLNSKANRIANSLIEKGVGIEDRVMFMMKRDSNLIATVLGIIKAGAAFIPIDPKYPEKRITQILEDSDSKYVIVSDGIDYTGQNKIDIAQLLNNDNDSNPNVDLTPDNLCFMIYTSGSTGKPKGVMITHKGISNYIACVKQNRPIYQLNSECKKFISISTVSFIVFLREIFGTILNGLPVVFADDEQSVNPLKLVELFEKTGADGFGSTPTRLLEYLELEEIRDVLAKCKIIIVGGEAFPPILYDNLSKYSDALIYNSYGPTEVTIASHYKLMDSSTVTAGWPMLNVVDKVMDIDGNQLPAYVTGEIYVGGAGIARGYLNNPEQTDKVFLTINNIPYYNTGDLGKKDANGELYVQGRNDTQIKLRGLRIELSEIETAISHYENIILSKVMVREVNDIEHLCAYYTASRQISQKELVEYLSQILPDYMIPSYFTQLDTFPKTPNGKVNFKKLPQPIVDDEEIIMPRNELEEEIHNILSQIIGTDNFGVNTNLFSIGLTSLNIIKLISHLHKKLNIELNVTDVLEYKNISEIASNITYAKKTEHEKMQYYPLTPNQLGVYFDCVKNPDSLAYNLAKRIKFSHDINPDKLKSSIITAINNHPYLKTQIVMKDGNVWQKRDDDADISDLIMISEDENIDSFTKPFKLDSEKLFRFNIVGKRILLSDFHHLIVDGMSLNILFDEIARIYDQKDYQLEKMDGYEYVLNEHENEKSDKFREAKKFFENKIGNFEQATVIPQDINGDEDMGNVKVEDILIDKNIIDSYCHEHNISQNNLFLSVISFVLTKFVYNKNLLIATITNGRFNLNQEKTIAMMVKTLPLALNINTDKSIREFYDYINGQWLDVLANSSYPLTRISDDFDITPEILYAYHGRIIEDIHMDDMTLKREAIGESGVKFKIAINVEEEDEGYNINCEYNDQLYSGEYIQTFLNSLLIVLEKFKRLYDKTQLKDISITLDDNWVEDDLDFIDIGEKRVNKIFESCVEKNGDDVALYACDGRYTFNQLNTKANRIANALIKRGVEVEDKVMIILKRNSNFIASMFGILKAGAAFIPIDSDYPKDRIEHVLTDSQSKYIICDDIIDIKNIDLSDYEKHLLDINDLLEEDNTDNPNTDVSESNLAYLIYTSGSTGLPKGVMLEHRNLANFTYPHPDNVYTYELATNYKKEDYRVLSTITVAFDVFLEETMCSLLNGVPIVLADDDTYKDPRATMELVNKYKANVYTATPSRILQYLQIGQIREDMLKFKVYAIAGEPFPNRLYEDLTTNSDALIFNVYGPTETTISCNTSLLTDSNITVGKELFNVKEQIMDLDSNPLPANVIGELYIAGYGVSRAYLNRPENNAKAYTTINNIKYYKSGDLAKRGSDGQIYVYGRLDNQIKLRGLRIEIGEIELAISRHEAIKDVAVVVRNINGNDYLCAYYTVYDEYKKDENYSIDINAFKEQLAESLVYYMIPTFFTRLDEFPRTPNDKIDLKNLPEVETNIDNYKNPSNEIQEKLWNIVSEILNYTNFGVDTDLFSIGLTSLTVMQVVSEIYEEFNTQLMITQVMKNKTIENIETLIRESNTEEYEEHQLYPLTPNQLGVYFECVKKPEDLSYNMPVKIEFGEEINPYKLKSAIINAINNHPYLKTRIIMDDGEVFQERRDNLVIDDYIEIIDGVADEDNFVQSFILDEGPLFRFKIFENTTLLADFHHIIMDGTSLNILFDEIARIYDQKDYTIEEINGFEYSLNEAKIEKSNLYKEAELFFFDKIKEFEEATIISPDLNGKSEDGVSLEKISYISKDVIDNYCDEHKINPNNLFLAVTSFVLSKFVYNRNLLIATLSNGRYTKSQERTLAMMVKTLPLALKLNTELSIDDYLSYVNDEWLNVLTYSSYPLTKISSDYDITPEFLYTYQGRINENIEISSKSVKREFIDYNFLKFNMGVQIEDVGDEYKVICQYNNQLYSDDLINTFMDSFNIVVNKFITYDNDTPLNTISIVKKDVISSDDIKIEEIPEYRINKIFENRVMENRDDIALYASDGVYTFNQLNTKANRIANALIKLGVEVEDKVMIVLKRNSDFIASIFGILKAGAAFIPIDSDYPKDRIEHVLTDSQSKYIICDDIVEIKNIDLSGYKEQLLDINDLLNEENTTNPDSDVKGQNLAYLIYTSGSTGLPKGVMLEHRNLANFVYPHPDNVYTYELATNYKKEDYRVLSNATVAFDLFLHELMCAILNGVPVVFADDDEYKDPKKTLDLIKKYDVTVYTATPSRLLQYLDIEELKDEMYGFKVYSIAGEAFPKRLYELLCEKTSAKLFNVYGPTETTISCNTVELKNNNITVGKALFNVHEEIMDYDSNPLPANVIGELYIAGSGVSREYLNRPEKNKEAYTEINNIRFYKSGDFAKRAEDGNVYIQGRLDNQIKLRGLRIEIGEIESAISKFKPIKDVAVVVSKIKNNQHLCAYFTVDDEYYKSDRKTNEFSFDINELKKTLSEKLTYYMVPTVYMQLDEMPQTLNGKTDLKNLPEPELITKYVAPENEVEAFFADTFAEILDLDKVSVEDNFFEIGGTSLLVTKITMAAINRDYEVYYGDVFKNPTPRKLANFVYNGASANISEESKYDYEKINELLKKNNIESLINGEMSDSLGDILLTGSTGFLGIHVLKELLNNEEGKIYCFVRSRGNLSGKDRLKSLFFYYFSEDYSDLFAKRIHVIEADITSASDFEKMMSYNVDTIINCAANVKHFSSGSDIEDINLGGVINGLKFAKMKECKYVQVSTYSVAGLSINNFPPQDLEFSENDLYVGQNLDNAYLNSKFLAERAVLEAAVEDDLDVKIMRAGNLMARSSDSEFQINYESNGFINRLKAFVNIGKMSYEMIDNPVEFSPIDTTAKSIIELAKTPKECTVFHTYNPHNITFADVINIISNLDINIEFCEEDEYSEALDCALKDKTKQDALSGIITNVGESQIKSVWLPITNNYTIQALYRLGIVWPLIDKEYVYNFIKHLDEVDFF